MSESKIDDQVKLFPKAPAFYSLKGTASLTFNSLAAAQAVFNVLEPSTYVERLIMGRTPDGTTVEAVFNVTLNAKELLTFLMSKTNIIDIKTSKARQDKAAKEIALMGV